MSIPVPGAAVSLAKSAVQHMQRGASVEHKKKMSTVDMIDLGLFGLGEKGSCTSGLVEDVEMYHSQELENLFSSHPNVENILDVSLHQSGITEETTVESEKSMLVSEAFIFSSDSGALELWSCLQTSNVIHNILAMGPSVHCYDGHHQTHGQHHSLITNHH